MGDSTAKNKKDLQKDDKGVLGDNLQNNEGKNIKSNNLDELGKHVDGDVLSQDRSNLYTQVGGESNVHTQADSQVMTSGNYSHLKGRGTIHSEEFLSIDGRTNLSQTKLGGKGADGNFNHSSAILNTPGTAPDSNNTPLSRINENKQGSYFEIEEESPPWDDQQRLDDG